MNSPVCVQKVLPNCSVVRTQRRALGVTPSPIRSHRQSLGLERVPQELSPADIRILVCVCGGGLGVAPPPAVPPGLICVIALGAEKALGHVPTSSPSFHCPRPYWSLPVLAVAPANTGVGSERGSHLCAAIRVLSVHR